jgi:hypothetical protein
MHTPVKETLEKGKTHRKDSSREDLFNRGNWEELKRNFEVQFNYEDSGFSGGNTHNNNTDQEVKKPISQEEFDELRRKFEERLKQFQSAGNNAGASPPPTSSNNSTSIGNNARVSPPPINSNNPLGVGNSAPNAANMAAPQRRTKVPLPTYKGKTDPDTYLEEFNNVCLAN